MGFKKSGILILLILLLSFTTKMDDKPERVIIKPHYKVALLLPLYLHDPEMRKNDTAKAIYDYYEGVQMAISDLKNLGIKLTLFVYDTEADSAVVDSLMKLPIMYSMHSILGPIYENTQVPASRFCAKTKIPLLSIIKHIPKLQPDSFPYINLVPSDSGLAYGQGQSLAMMYPNASFFVISDGLGRHYKERKLFKEGYAVGGGKKISQLEASNLSKMFETARSEKVVVYAPTDSVAILKRLVNQAAMGKIVLSLPKSARKIHDFGKDQMIKGQVIYGDNNYFYKYEDRALSFRIRYRKEFKWEANKYQFMGYDQLYWLGQSLMTFQRNYPKALGPAFYSGIMQQFSLKQCKEGSYENTGCQIVRYNSNGARELVNP
jgi:hypothetical protein